MYARPVLPAVLSLWPLWTAGLDKASPGLVGTSQPISTGIHPMWTEQCGFEWTLLSTAPSSWLQPTKISVSISQDWPGPAWAFILVLEPSPALCMAAWHSLGRAGQGGCSHAPLSCMLEQDSAGSSSLFCWLFLGATHLILPSRAGETLQGAGN